MFKKRQSPCAPGRHAGLGQSAAVRSQDHSAVLTPPEARTHLLSPRPPSTAGPQPEEPVFSRACTPTVSGSHSHPAGPGLGPIIMPLILLYIVFLLLADSSLPPEKLQFYLSPELIPSTWRMPEISPECVCFYLTKQVRFYILSPLIL